MAVLDRKRGLKRDRTKEGTDEGGGDRVEVGGLNIGGEEILVGFGIGRWWMIGRCVCGISGHR